MVYLSGPPGSSGRRGYRAARPDERTITMKIAWIKPDFLEIGVNAECTAYAGAA